MKMISKLYDGYQYFIHNAGYVYVHIWYMYSNNGYSMAVALVT